MNSSCFVCAWRNAELPAGRKAREVDAEIRQPEHSPKWPLVASGHARGERLGIVAAERARRGVRGEKGDGRVALSDMG